MKGESRIYRLRAVLCEQRARDASDQLIKAEWDELAIEWHLLANAVAPQIDQPRQVFDDGGGQFRRHGNSVSRQPH
jgi:hypothetical protein